jgi:hypothetical protein
MYTRRRFLVLGATSAAALAASACSSGGSSRPPVADAASQDFSARFSKFDVADAPNGDLSKVVWPDYITNADPEVKRLYEFQITHGELMRYMPCFCGCGRDAGHRNNRDCYVKTVGADGSVTFDAMAPT